MYTLYELRNGVSKNMKFHKQKALSLANSTHDSMAYC